MLIIGHRGAAGHETENTLAAFDAGLKLGADWLEMDIRRAGSGELVVFHDDSLMRLAGDMRSVAELSLPELQAIPLEGRHHIPSLAETLNHLAGRATLCIELKEEGLVETVLDMAAKAVHHGQYTWENLWFISFLHPELSQLKHRNPAARIAPILAGLPEDYAAFAEHLKADAVHPCLHFINHEFMADAHQRGLPVRVWTANEPQHIDRAFTLKVDAIASDFPERVAQRRHAA